MTVFLGFKNSYNAPVKAVQALWASAWDGCLGESRYWKNGFTC